MTESTELATVNRDGALAERMAYAQALAAAELLPASYRKKPANVLLAMEYGRALGLDTVTAIQQVHIVEGKPTASAQLIGSLVRRAGHRLRVSGDDKHAVAEIVRRDDHDFTFRAEWTIERAAAAGLAGKGVWKQYPAAMLKARAITEVARDACPEALAGVAYTAEELGDDQGEDFESQAAVHTVELAEEKATLDRKAVMKLIAHSLTRCGVADPEQRRHIINVIIDREIESPDELTGDEAQWVAEVLQGLADDAEPEKALAEWLNADGE